MAQEAERLCGQDIELHVFEKSSLLGAGTPYDPNVNDPEHLLNVRAGSVFMPERDFLKWIEENSHAGGIIEQTLHDVLTARLTKKFRALFDVEFDEGAEYSGAQLALKQTRDTSMKKLMGYCRNLEESLRYHQRILVGIYHAAIFEQNLKRLEENGVKVVRHPATEVVAISPDAKLGFVEDSIKHELTFDEVVLASGSWSENPQLEGDSAKRYVKLYPVTKLHDKLFQLIADAKASGKKEISIAVEGSGLSAIDAVRTLFHDQIDEKGNFIGSIDGVTIHVDIVSRGGQLQKVKGHFSGSAREVAQVWGDNGKPLDHERPAQVIQDKIDALPKDKSGHIHLWQIFELFSQTLLAVYLKAGNTARADEFAQLLNFIEQNRENYVLIAEKFFEKLSGTNHADPFITLERDLHAAEKGDVADGTRDLLWQMVYQPFDMLAIAAKLPADERIFRLEMMRRFHSIHAEGMPPQSAREMLTLHRAGVLDVVAIGHNASEKTADETGITISGKKYDMVVNTTGHGHDIRQHPAPLFQSMIEQDMISFSSSPVCKIDQLETYVKNLMRKIGKEAAARIVSHLEARNGVMFYCRGEIRLDNRHPVAADEKVAEKISIISGGGIHTLHTKGAAVAEDFLKKIISTSPQNPAVSQLSGMQGLTSRA